MVKSCGSTRLVKKRKKKKQIKTEKKWNTFESQHRGLCLQYLLSHVTQLVDLLRIQEELAVL